MTNKYLLIGARIISTIFTPFYLPVMAFVLLFIFSYLHLLPLSYKALLLLMVWAFTVILPHVFITLYRRLNGWARHQMGHKERRIVPYALSITCYAVLLYLMYNMNLPRFTLSIIAAALVIQVACAVINTKVKISTHAAAAGGVLGALMGFSVIFNFDPTDWLCLSIFVCGLVCSSRLLLRQHTLPELAWGTAVGIVSGLFCVLLI